MISGESQVATFMIELRLIVAILFGYMRYAVAD